MVVVLVLRSGHSSTHSETHPAACTNNRSNHSVGRDLSYTNLCTREENKIQTGALPSPWLGSFSRCLLSVPSLGAFSLFLLSVLSSRFLLSVLPLGSFSRFLLSVPPRGSFFKFLTSSVFHSLSRFLLDHIHFFIFLCVRGFAGCLFLADGSSHLAL